MNKKPRFNILVDTREQKPYGFKAILPSSTITVQTLKTGDYSIQGFESSGITIERKNLNDLYGTIGKGRRRFIRELERMAKFDFAALVIEADWNNIIRHPPTRSKLNPKSVFRSIIAWEQRYGIHVWACPGRSFAEQLTFRILERYAADHEKIT